MLVFRLARLNLLVLYVVFAIRHFFKFSKEIGLFFTHADTMEARVPSQHIA